MQPRDELAAILRGVQGDRAVLTVQVVSTDWGRQYTLNSYRADGMETVLPYAERVQFTEAAFMAALDATGWGMPERPVKLPGLNHRYILKRGAVSEYTPRSTTAQQVERYEREKRLREIAVADEMDAEFLAAMEAA